MPKEKNKKQTLLTLEILTDYNREIFIPELREIFAGKKEFEEFKNKSLTNQDKMLKKLDTLLAEKDVRDYQDKKQKKLLAIVIRSLREHGILSSKEIEEITRLEFF